MTAKTSPLLETSWDFPGIRRWMPVCPFQFPRRDETTVVPPWNWGQLPRGLFVGCHSRKSR